MTTDREDRLEDVDLDGQPAPARLERVIPGIVSPLTTPELYDDADEDAIDQAIRLAQGDVLDGFQRTNPTLLEALGLTVGDDLAGAAIDAYRSVWREEAGR